MIFPTKQIGILIIGLILFTSIAAAQEKQNLIQTTAPFASGGKVAKHEVAGKFFDVETGTLNGVDYEIWYGDGSAYFGNTRSYGALDPTENWRVTCKKDAIDDSKQCDMNFHDFWIFDLGDEPFVSVGSDLYPGSEVAIRIDGTPAFKSRAKGMFLKDQSKKIIEQLKTAKTLTTRYTKWPAGTDKDDTFQLAGFNEALTYMSWAITKIK